MNINDEDKKIEREVKEIVTEFKQILTDIKKIQKKTHEFRLKCLDFIARYKLKEEQRQHLVDLVASLEKV